MHTIYFEINFDNYSLLLEALGLSLGHLVCYLRVAYVLVKLMLHVPLDVCRLCFHWVESVQFQ